ncbi:Protein kinase domain-containing protein [Mycena chlorophos]|uniref:Protein kinase domain-containing protein n=1 Tax=Mycena chlorophos TaxID=658473 RepID=A0A8H6T557_MYCCL|nr:Protein kinase domain-containing protein [Mycena chlorophos]
MERLILEANEKYMPKHQMQKAQVAHPGEQFGLESGASITIRNAGGSAEVALPNILVAQHAIKAGSHIAVVHHTDCGMTKFSTAQMHELVKRANPGDAEVAAAVEQIDFHHISDLEESVRKDVNFLKISKMVKPATEISGWIFDVESGKRSRFHLVHNPVNAQPFRVSTMSLSTQPVIAVDLDDVLCQTNFVVAEWHNEHFNTQMTINDFYYFYYWKNPFWGSPEETALKVKKFYETDPCPIFLAPLVPGAREGVQALKDMGYKLHIVTARNGEIADASWEYVQKHFPGIFDSLLCTGQFKDMHKHPSELMTNLTKSQVCTKLGAQVLIDDSSENAIQCGTALQPTPVLLFGEYPWNRRISMAGEGVDTMAFNVRLEASNGQKFWEQDAERFELPEGAPIHRVQNWAETIKWIQEARSTALLVLQLAMPLRRHLPTLYAHPEDDDDSAEHDGWEMGSQSSRPSSAYYANSSRTMSSRPSTNQSLPADGSSSAYTHFLKRYRSGVQDETRSDPDSHYYQNGLGQLNDAGDSDDEAHTSFSAADLSVFALESEASLPESNGEREQWRAMLASVLAGDVLKTEKTRIATVLESTASEKEQFHNNVFLGIRAKLHGKTPTDMRMKLNEQRIRTVDIIIDEVLNFCLEKDTCTTDALQKVFALLQRLEFIQSLYPSLKALDADRPVCTESRFIDRRDALITWYTVITSAGHQIARLQRWTGSETLDVNQRNTSAEKPIGPHVAGVQATNSDIADGSSFAERLLKEDTMQRMFERRFLVIVHKFLVQARAFQIRYAPEFKSMNLPTFEVELVPLIAFPTQLSQAALRMRLEYVANLKDPEVMIIDQMSDDLKINIGLACTMKRQYEEFLQSDPQGNWNIPQCISDDYDATILDAMKVFFKLIHWKLKSGAKGIYFKETDVLEAQWDTFNDVCLTVSNGSCLIGEELCSTTNKLMVRVTNYFDTQVQVPTGKDPRESRRHKRHPEANGRERMTSEQMVNWYGKILDSVRLRYRKLQRFVRELTHRYSNSAEYDLEDIRMELFIRTLVETGHFLVYTGSYEEESTYIVASPTLLGDPDAITRILTEAHNVRVDDQEEPQYLLLLSPITPFIWNGHTEERTDIPHIPLEPSENRVRLVSDGPQHRLTLAKDMFLDMFFLEDENGDVAEPEILMRCTIDQFANIPSVNRELRKIARATTRLAESIINSVGFVQNALHSSDGCQELLENWFSFASDHAQHAQKFMERSVMIRFDRALIKHAIAWVSFICDDCDPSDRKTFRWAVNALEFTFGRIKRNIQQLPEDQFVMLRHKVARCMALLQTHFDILGARSNIEAKKEKERQAAMLMAQVDSGGTEGLVDFDESSGTRAHWERVVGAVGDLEASRLIAIATEHHQTFGRVLDSSKPEDRTLAVLASASSNVSIRWQQVKFIGAGAFGSVYSAVNLDNLTVMAVKEIKFQELSGLPNLYAQIKDELSVMELLHHPNIVEYYGIEVHRDKVYIFEEFCQGGSLAALLEHGRIEDESIIQIYTMQMLDGLAYLHSQGIVHRDIKPDNILLDHRGVIKFVDFGAAKILAKNQRTMQRSRRVTIGTETGFQNKGLNQNSLTGTPMYMSPEVIKNEKRGRQDAMDIWSLGCVVLEFATGKKPWSNLDNEWAIMFHIATTQHPPLPEPGQLSDLGVAFIKRCLTIDPLRRPSAEELKNDLWLSTLRATWATYENTEAPADEEAVQSAIAQEAAEMHDDEVAEILRASPSIPSTPEEL